jgi:DNA modification methylase
MLGKEYDRERSLEEYKKYHSDVIKECHRVLTEDGALYWNVAQTPWDGEILPLGAIFYDILKKKNFYLKNWIIWHFEGGLNAKKRLSGRYENILWTVKDKKNFVFNLDDIRIPAKWHMDKRCNPKGKNPTDFWTEVDYVWDINRVVNVSKEKTSHPTQFPEKMIKRIIKASSNKGDIVMDVFSGSGTVMKVAQDEGRKWIGIDKESKYCKIAQKRVMSSITK